MNDYKLLAKYYQECFSLIDTFHFNVPCKFTHLIFM